MLLTETLVDRRAAFQEFANEYVAPYAQEADKTEKLPETIISKLGEVGYLGAAISTEYGGQGWDQQTVGILTEEIGKACSSVRTLLTVHHSLVSETIQRWATEEQKEKWLPSLASGKKIAAFCLSEPEVGSDAKNITCSYKRHGDHYLINGTKKWISFGQRADLYLVFANSVLGMSAFLVERNTPGVSVKPINGLLGTRATATAEISFDNCMVEANCLLGKEGWGFLQVANTALDNGRFSVACGSVGIARGCLEESTRYADQRKQFDVYLKDHQLIKRKLTNMLTEAKAASMMCSNAAFQRDTNPYDSWIHTSMAKYFSSQVANKAAYETVQIHGAVGCHQDSPAQRFFRDARIMEIIEGSSEIQQITIADYGINNWQSIMDAQSASFSQT